MEPPVPGRHLRPLLLLNHPELAQGIHAVLGVHRGSPGHIVHVDEALGIKEGQDHLLHPGHMDLGLDQPRLSLHMLLLALLLGLGCVKQHRRLIHGDNLVQHRHGVAAEQHHEGLTDPHPLVFHLLV